MRLLIYILILLLFDTSPDEFCDCFPLSSKTINGLKTKSDLIAIGKPIKKIKSNAEYEEEIIVFEIDSLIKGKSDIQTIMINQNNAGNCSEYFELFEEYLITGDKIASAKETYRMGQTYHSEGLEEMINQNYMISTNGCKSFRL